LFPGQELPVPAITNATPFWFSIRNTKDFEGATDVYSNGWGGTENTGGTMPPLQTNSAAGSIIQGDPINLAPGVGTNLYLATIPTNSLAADRQNAVGIISAITAGDQREALLLSNLTTVIKGQGGGSNAAGNFAAFLTNTVTGLSTNGTNGLGLGQGSGGFGNLVNSKKPAITLGERTSPTWTIPLATADEGIGLGMEDFEFHFASAGPAGYVGQWETWVTWLRGLAVAFLTYEAITMILRIVGITGKMS
jgi:hypothetical protein